MMALCVRFSRVLALAFAATLITVSATAQTPATGTIRGTISNATNGQTLENVVLRITGGKQAISNSYGDYEFTGVPAGDVEIRASYIGEADIVATVTVAGGDVARRDFTFREKAAQVATNKDGAVELSPYTVNAERYRNARAVAVAEERNSINIKNVVSTDQFGYVPSGNVGEFTKFLPGVQIDYGASNGNSQGYSENTANGVSVRGFGPEDTAILIDGMPVASTLPGNLTRQVGLDQLSINNAERIELIKVATPDMPANSVGGQINLITRNAFEYAKPTYGARLFFNYNSLANGTFKKTAGPVNKGTYKTTPGFDASVSYPFSKNLGVTISGSWQDEFSQSYRAQPTWNNGWTSTNPNYQNGAFTNAAGQASSNSNPVLTRYQITDSPTITDRKSGNVRVDWRPTPNQSIRANVQYSTYQTTEAQRRLDFRPTIATGVVWDGTQVVGSTANSNTGMTVTTRDRVGDTVSGQLQYSINVWGFQLDAAGSYSKSVSDFEDEANGHYSGLDLNLNPGRVALYGLEQGIPSRAETFTRTTNLPLDYTQLSNWAVASAIAQSGESHNETMKGIWKVDLSRPLDFLHFLGSNSLTFKTGFRHDEETNEKSGRGTGYRSILQTGKTFTVADILDTNYLGQSPGFGLAPQQWASTYKLYEVGKANDLFYAPTGNESTNTAISNYNSYVGQQKSLKEGTDGWYAQLSGRFLDGRLNFVGGARQEKKSRVGKSPYTDSKWMYVKNKDGSLYTDAAHPAGVRMDQTASDLFQSTAAGTTLRSALTAAGISYPAAAYGSVTTDLAARMLNFQPLHEINQHVTGDPSYSLNVSYKLTKKIDLKAAYSRSFKLQNLESGVAGGIISGTNNFTFQEYTVSEQASNQGALGQITVANPSLKPETSNNWDYEVSYYNEAGGKFTVSYYTKSVTNQVMNFTTYDGSPEFDAVLNALSLSPSDFGGWRVVTSANASTVQKTSGWEFQAQQDLGFIGRWGRRFSGFVSYSFTDFPTPSSPEPYTITNPDGTTTTLTPTVNTVTLRANRFGGAGLQYSGDRLSVQVRGTYRNDNELGGNRLTLANGNFLRRFQPAETRIDLNVGYMLSKHYSLFLSGRDIFNGERDEVWRDDQGQVPAYANLADRKKFGVTWTFGVSGTW